MSSTELKDPRFLYGPGESLSSTAPSCRLASAAARRLMPYTLYALNAAAPATAVTPTVSSAALPPLTQPQTLRPCPRPAASTRLLNLK